MLSNWKTTVTGIVLAALQIVPQFGHIGSLTIRDWLTAIGTITLGALAKDHNVTGGTIQQ